MNQALSIEIKWWSVKREERKNNTTTSNLHCNM